MPELRPKLIYVARRHPALTKAEFILRWRRHGALGMSLPRWRNIARYVHCDALAAPRPTSAIAADIDGIGMIWHRSPAARAAHVADTSSRETMEEDERETFDRPIVDSCALMREQQLVVAAPGQSPFKVTRLLRAHEPARREDLTRQLLERAAEKRELLRQSGLQPGGHMVNEPLPPERNGRRGLAVDCIEELWFDTAEAAIDAAEQLAAARRLDGDVPAGCIQVLTNEVVLYDVHGRSEA